MATHVPLLRFLGFREVLCNVFYIDEWPREIISFANSLEPGGFCWEARRAMEIPNSGFNAGEFIYVVEVLLAVILAHLECYIVMEIWFVWMVYMELRLFCPDG